jgi:lipid-binding SYLF domain-containing protein
MWTRYSVAALALAACATKTPSMTVQRNLEQEAAATLAEMEARQPGLKQLIADSAGYAVFPDIGSAGAFIAGGAFGKGILFQNGVPTGYVELKQGSVGLELGGQTYSELLVLRDRYDIDRLMTGQFNVGAGATAVILKTGAAAATDLDRTVNVFVVPRGGMMAGITVSGQKIDYKPLG